MKYVSLAICLVVVLSAFNSRTPAGEPVAGSDAVMSRYLLLKNSLLTSDSAAAARHADTLSMELGKLRVKKASLFLLDSLQRARTEAITLAKDIAATQNINKQRKQFAPLSEKVWFWVKRQPRTPAPLYRQRCPMTGETWISSDAAIRNPFYPKNMLTCGEVMENL